MLRPVVVLSLFLILLAGPSLFAKPLIVGAAASLQDVLKPIAREFEKNNKGVEINFNFSGTNVITRQVLAGAPIDVIIAADEANIKKLLQEKVIEQSSVQNVAANQLVVVTGLKSLKISSPQDLVKKEIKRIAVADEQVPIGRYAREYLGRKNLLQPVASKIVKVDNVRAALAMARKKAVDVAFVYKTDWHTMAKELTMAIEVPTQETWPIVYPAAVTTQCQNKQRCLDFVRFLSNAGSQKTFAAAGFTRVTP